MTAARKAKPTRKFVYATVRALVDPRTGESVKAFVAEHVIDRRLLNERKLKVGADVRLEIKAPRNIGFHRKLHSLAGFLREHVDGFEACKDDHDAIKQLQRESGVCCETQEIDLGPLGKVLAKMPESLRFDEMPPERFEICFNGLLDWARDTYRPELAEAEFVALMDYAEVSR